MHQLTTQDDVKLSIELESFDGDYVELLFNKFVVMNERNGNAVAQLFE